MSDHPLTATTKTAAHGAALTSKPPLSPVDNPSRLDDASFYMVMTHLYRAEMQRMTVWRTRLDTTSNWAILLVMGMTTLTLGTRTAPHYLLLLGLAVIGIVLLIEGRRYQHLHHSKWRLGLMECCYFGEIMLAGGCPAGRDWRQSLSADLKRPHFTISWGAAVRLRLRRNYLMLIYFIFGVWITKVLIHPVAAPHAASFYSRLAVGPFLPAWLVAASATLTLVGTTALALSSPSEEALEHWSREQREGSGESGPEES